MWQAGSIPAVMNLMMKMNIKDSCVMNCTYIEDDER